MEWDNGDDNRELPFWVKVALFIVAFAALALFILFGE